MFHVPPRAVDLLAQKRQPPVVPERLPDIVAQCLPGRDLIHPHPAVPQHELLDALLDHGRHTAEVVAHPLDLLDHRLQELRVRAVLVEEVVDEDAFGLLPVAVDAAVALFEPDRVPRDLVVDHVAAVVLQVQPLGRRVGRKQDPNRMLARVGLEGLLDLLPVAQAHAAGQAEDVLFSHPGSDVGLQVLERVEVLGEDDQPLPVPVGAGAEVFADPGFRGPGAWRRARGAASPPSPTGTRGSCSPRPRVR